MWGSRIGVFTTLSSQDSCLQESWDDNKIHQFVVLTWVLDLLLRIWWKSWIEKILYRWGLSYASGISYFSWLLWPFRVFLMIEYVLPVHPQNQFSHTTFRITVFFPAFRFHQFLPLFLWMAYLQEHLSFLVMNFKNIQILFKDTFLNFFVW